MNKQDEKKRNSAMTMIAQGQSIAGKVMVIGQGMMPGKTEVDPYRILDDVPVYYSGHNIFELEYDFENKIKLTKWGQFYHPYMMIGMPDAGGKNKLYVDTSVNGWYILLVFSKLDESDIGPSNWVWSVVSWTPKQKGDSIVKAGYRMFWAIFLAMDYVPGNEFYSDGYDEEGNWFNEWECSERCFQVIASIRKTIYKNETEFNKIYSISPEILKVHLKSMKLI